MKALAVFIRLDDHQLSWELFEGPDAAALAAEYVGIGQGTCENEHFSKEEGPFPFRLGKALIFTLPDGGDIDVENLT